MQKIITGFKTIQDVKDTLQWIEDNTDYVWADGGIPTEWYEECEGLFEKYNSDGWFVIQYKDLFRFYSLKDFLLTYEQPEQINFQDLINQNNFKEWELVEVSDMDYDYKQRIYLCTIPWNVRNKYVCVDGVWESEYKAWEIFSVS